MKIFVFRVPYLLQNVKQSNYIFEIMTQVQQQQQYEKKQIVWAKVPNYPWWPAKITKILFQGGQRIYRVSFFGDPTYCFLQPYQLIDFQAGLTALSSEIENNINTLKKPIQLAKSALKKVKLQTMEIGKQQLVFVPGTQYLFEQAKCQSKIQIENSNGSFQKYKNETANFVQITEFKCLLQSIIPQNSIQIISNQFNHLKSSKGYSIKKQVFLIQERLKQMLLLKYSLLHIKSPQQQTGNEGIIFKKRKESKKQNKPKFEGRQTLLLKSYRKLHRILRNSFCQQSINIKSLFFQIVNQLKFLEYNYKKWYSSYMKVVRQLKQIHHQLNQQHIHPMGCDLNKFVIERIRNSFSNNFVVNLPEQELQRQDEQKSKFTQIQS